MFKRHRYYHERLQGLKPHLILAGNAIRFFRLGDTYEAGN